MFPTYLQLLIKSGVHTQPTSVLSYTRSLPGLVALPLRSPIPCYTVPDRKHWILVINHDKGSCIYFENKIEKGIPVVEY